MSRELYCDKFNSQPCPDAGTVLVTGATGYIGGRLVPELLARGYRVKAMLRAPLQGYEERFPGVETVIADASDLPALRLALQGVHTAYYLIHSLLLGLHRFESVDAQSARNFRRAAEEAGVKRIIYLGGLGDVRTTLSTHLRSRAQVAQDLHSPALNVTVLRAAVIVGSGSASYEIVRHLVDKLPVIPIPIWGRTKCQPIAIRDVIRYLVGALGANEADNRTFDIGGEEIMTYECMLRTLVDILGKRRLFIHVPGFASNVRAYAYLAGLLTPVAAPMTRSLMEGLRNDVVCENDAIRSIVPFKTLSYKEAILDAMTREEKDEIHTRWSDAYPPAHELAMKLSEVEPPPKYQTSYSIASDKPAGALFDSVCRIGGKSGWFRGNWMWRLRGKLDSLLMGVGAARGRRHQSRLWLNDVLDFWRVEAVEQNRRLLLRAEMTLPGKAWLEFEVTPDGTRNVLRITAYYDTHTILGHCYWFLFLPFHWYIFDNLIKHIEARS